MTLYGNRWREIEIIGEGGQAIVYKVLDNHQWNFANLGENLILSINNLKDPKDKTKYYDILEHFNRQLQNINQLFDPNSLGALKLLRKDEHARDLDLANYRFRKEIQILQGINHPNIIKVLDVNEEDGYIVMKYYQRQSLSKNQNIFHGNILKSLYSFKGLVEGVAELHKKSIVHRDIKPTNIFLSENDNLILGDFGLAYNDDGEERKSKTFENVGSRDWMPTWAHGIRQKDIKPSFDLFSLGKVLWAMISGRPKLPLHYWKHEDHNLERLFPKQSQMILINKFLKKCVVEFEKDSILPDAKEMLNEINDIIYQISNRSFLIDKNILTKCMACGQGNYELMGNPEMYGFNQPRVKIDKMELYRCMKCGNTQLFLK